MSIKICGAKLKSFKIHLIFCRAVVVSFACESNTKLEKVGSKVH